jgi:serine/tyrosine/threonine adenylyltransferase
MTEISTHAPESPGIHGPGAPPFAFDNSYARLPERFFARLAPTPAPAPRLVRLNETLARHLGCATFSLR